MLRLWWGHQTRRRKLPTVWLDMEMSPGPTIGLMRFMHHLTLILGLSAAGCAQQDPPTPAVAEPPLIVQARARAVRDGLKPSMTDEQILRTIGNDPALLQARSGSGIDGHMTEYSNKTTLIWITRSLSTGISVLRLRPEEQKQHWMMNTK